MASIQFERELKGREFPIGQRVTLPGHFPEPVVLEAVRPIGAGYECRVRLPDGSPDEAILSADEAELLFGQASTAGTKVAPAEADKLRLLVESARIRFGLYPRSPFCGQPVGHSHPAPPNRGGLHEDVARSE